MLTVFTTIFAITFGFASLAPALSQTAQLVLVTLIIFGLATAIAGALYGRQRM